MADVKFEVMTSFLSEFDKSLTAEELKAYVWLSFSGTAPWNELTEEERKKYRTTAHEIEKNHLRNVISIGMVFFFSLSNAKNSIVLLQEDDPLIRIKSDEWSAKNEKDEWEEKKY